MVQLGTNYENKQQCSEEGVMTLSIDSCAMQRKFMGCLLYDSVTSSQTCNLGGLCVQPVMLFGNFKYLH